jgi:hypothetical protein
VAAVTQMTRFKNDKADEMIKKATNAKALFEKRGAEFLRGLVSRPACGPESDWL